MRTRIETIVNKSPWNTRDLRKLFTLISKHEDFYPSYLKITTTIGLTNVLGEATLGGGWVKMKLPTKRYGRSYEQFQVDLDTIEGSLLKQVAQVYIHELGHNRGLNHKDMVKWYNIDVDYIDGMVIHRKKEIKKNPEARLKLKNYHYNGHVAQIYRYPWRVTSMSMNGRETKGFWYTFLIHNKITKNRIYRMKRRSFYPNIDAVRKEIRTIITKKINK